MDDSQGRLLIVEDDTALRRSLRTTLDVLGFDIGEAANGEDGLWRPALPQHIRGEEPKTVGTVFAACQV